MKLHCGLNYKMNMGFSNLLFNILWNFYENPISHMLRRNLISFSNVLPIIALLKYETIIIFFFFYTCMVKFCRYITEIINIYQLIFLSPIQNTYINFPFKCTKQIFFLNNWRIIKFLALKDENLCFIKYE